MSRYKTIRHSILALLIVCYGCNPSSKKSEEKNNNDVYSDSIFRYHNKILILDDSLNRDYDKGSSKFNLHALSDDDRKLLTSSILGPGSLYEAYYYSKQNKVRNTTPILILANGDDYQSVVLFLVSDQKSVTDHLELTADACDVIGQEGESENLGCNKTDSEFLNDSTVRVTNLKVFIDRYKEVNEVTTTDSLITDYRITGLGKITVIKKDSIRSVKAKK